MRLKQDNEDGIAYALVAVIMFVAIAGLLFVCYAPVMNAIIGQANVMIGNGEVGVQTAGAMEWSMGLFLAIPIISLLGIVGWAYIRTLEERGV